ncbi:serine/threonine-protein kinase ppk4-like [Gymnodraco acuticeps]|uniref:Serine/threonine-protein kinase ppk4-like n=1 Tax=Gymnodraco acuticeps TaxID=8218 RepID=A0A6P8VGQ5_GYMAC|nr:serine/threonine-protein kinase ppk4-like [Gymnodraco acuticeps]
MEQASAKITLLLGQLSQEQFDRKGILKELFMITRTTKSTTGWDPKLNVEVCKTIALFVSQDYSDDIRALIYNIYTNVLSVEHAGKILEMRILKDPEEVLRRLTDHFNKLTLECGNGLAFARSENKADTQGRLKEHTAGPHGESTQTTDYKPKWLPNSLKWKETYQELVSSVKEGKLTLTIIGNGSMKYVNKDEFRIAMGKNGTEVFLGLRDDGTEIAIKKMTRCNYEVLKNEEGFLRLPELDYSSIVRYMAFAEDENFGYLGLQLCECTLEEYIKTHGDDGQRKTVVFQVLKGLRVLHCQDRPILHRDLKPQNVLIDVNGRARLADFGISRRLPKDQTTYRTGKDGTRCWMAKETLSEKDETKIPYKSSSDIQVAGMLIYYILSRGHHPFGEESFEFEYNIVKGIYALEHVQDVLAKDLIKWMIDAEPEKRPKVEECLNHAFFWNPYRKVEYLKKIGDRKEVERYKDADQEFISSLDKCAGDGAFNGWKHTFPPELMEKMEGKKKCYPENTLGLLRFIRNLHHHAKEAAEMDLLMMFPNLMEYVYIFAKSKGWNYETPLMEMCRTELPQIYGITTIVASTPKNSEADVPLSVQESPRIFTLPTANEHLAGLRRFSI